MDNFTDLADRAIKELEDSVKAVDPSQVETVINAITAAKRITLYGVGREGLMMKAFAMRLHHMGLNAHVVGDMTTPPLGPGDLLLVSAGPGYFSTVAALIEVAGNAGALTVCFTAQPKGVVPASCHIVMELPAQTMADDQKGKPSLLPMGSLYEGAQFIIFELLVLSLCQKIGITLEAMRARHTNLE